MPLSPSANKKTVCCVFPRRGPGGKIYCCGAVVASIVILPPPRVPLTLPVGGRKAWGTGGHSDDYAATPSDRWGKGLQKTLLLSSGRQVGNHAYSGGQQGRRIIARWQGDCFTSVFWQASSCTPGWGIPAAPPAQRRYQRALGNWAHANSKPHYGCLLRKQPHNYRQA